MIHLSENPSNQMNKYFCWLRVVALCLTPRFCKAKAETYKTIEEKSNDGKFHRVPSIESFSTKRQRPKYSQKGSSVDLIP